MLKDRLCLFTAEGGTGGGAEGQQCGGDDLPLTRVKESLDDIISLCVRSSHSLDEEQRQVVCGLCCSEVSETRDE